MAKKDKKTTTRKERTRKNKAAEAARRYRQKKKLQKQPEVPEQKKIISPPEDRFKKLEQQRKRQKLYQCQKEANNEVKRAELLKLVPVTEAEAKLNPKLQARLDDVTTGVDRLCVESTEPQLRWIEEECICLSSSEADG